MLLSCQLQARMLPLKGDYWLYFLFENPLKTLKLKFFSFVKFRLGEKRKVDFESHFDDKAGDKQQDDDFDKKGKKNKSNKKFDNKKKHTNGGGGAGGGHKNGKKFFKK